MVGPGDPAVIQLSSVYREVGVGDKLVPAGKPEIPTYAPRAPANAVKGRVISIYGGTDVGQRSRQAIGHRDQPGQEPGIGSRHVVALYRSGAAVAEQARSSSKDTRNAQLAELPDERYGLAFVFRVFDRVSYALVMNVSKPVNILDLVQNP